MLIFLGIILILAGIGGIAVSTMAFGDIGVAIAIGGTALFFIGVVCLIVNGRLKKLEKLIKQNQP